MKQVYFEEFKQKFNHIPFFTFKIYKKLESKK